MFAHPLGLLALLAVPAVIALHLFRRRFRPQPVSAVFLWVERDRTQAAGRRLQPLRSSASLACELLGALAIALAIAGPRGCGPAEARHLVVVVDGSASMGARLPRGAPVERARELLERELARLPAGSSVSLVASGKRPRVLAGPGATARDAREALAAFEPRAGRHDPGPALSLASELAGGGAVLWLTDRMPAEPPPREVALHALGEPAANACIAGARRERGATGEERVTLVVASFADAPATRRLEVRAGDVLVASRELRLGPGERRVLDLELPAAAELEQLALVAELSGDALELDDRAYLVAEPRRVVALAVDVPAEEARALNLADQEASAGRWARSVPRAAMAPDADSAHLALARGPAGGPSTWCLSLEPLGEGREELIGPFLLERAHPLLEGLTLEGIVWSADPELLLPGVPLVSAGNLPLLSEERDGGRLLLRANLDPARSSLQRSPDWPILLANLVELRRRELPGPERANLALGEPLVYRAARPGRLTLRSPSGTERGFDVRDVLVVDDLDEPGVHELLDGGRTIARYALSFVDPGASDLRGLSSGERGSEVELAAGLRPSSKLEALLLALGALLLLLDWRVLRPRAGAGTP